MGRLNPIVWLGIISASTFLFFKTGFSSLPLLCLFEETIQLHCPFCGLTLAFETLIQGDLKKAIIINPLCVLLPIYFCLDTYFKQMHKYHFQKKISSIFIVFALFNLIYLNF